MTVSQVLLIAVDERHPGLKDSLPVGGLIHQVMEAWPLLLALFLACSGVVLVCTCFNHVGPHLSEGNQPVQIRQRLLS